VQIVLNGDRLEVAGPRSVKALLEDLGIDARLVAVELNRLVVKRDRHAETMVTDGAEVEIVAFVGGGCPDQDRRRPSNRPTRRSRCAKVNS
jgi:sulfur carrier protein